MVAEEIKALADESMQATKEIQNITAEIKKATNQTNNTLYSAVDELTNSSQQQLQLIKQVVAANKQLKKN